MTNKEQVQRDIAVAFDFIEQIIDNPELTDKIPEGAAISFIDEENRKTEKLSPDASGKISQRKYVKVKRHFEVL
ncbi:MAG: hypothetical protein AB7S72_07095 [Draconibacterium sp.]